MFGKKARIRRIKKMRVVVEDITGGLVWGGDRGGDDCRRGGCCSTGMVDGRWKWMGPSWLAPQHVMGICRWWGLVGV